ncbi:MAG: Crp/Fnr family transcriptional regulator [Mariniphaga sp.]|nr:Crp/Fnr family transcriptional regulator [Mariniphaga sp.]
MIAFRNFIENYTVLPDHEWKFIQKAFNKKEYSKNEIILAEGRICKYFYFLEEGLLRYFVLNDGNDVTRFFTIAPYCFTSKDSFRNQTPATENIQALKKSIVWQTTLSQSNKLLELKSWNTFTRNFIHEVQSYTEELLFEIKTESARQRYIKLLEKYPGQIQNIPLKYLSIFLGIAPQSLSRIRKNTLKY